MAENNNTIKTHIDNAINLWKGIVSFDYNIYVEFLEGLLKSHYRFYNIENIDLDELLICAIEKRPYNYVNDNPPPCFPFVFDHDKSIHENLKAWCNKIERINRINNDVMSLSDISSETGKKLWETLKVDDGFIKDTSVINLFSNFHNKKTREFYQHIIKSILKAEYLFLQDYSQKLEDAISSLAPDFKDDNVKTETQSLLRPQKIENINKPCFVKDFIIIALQLQDMCWRIKNAIGKENKRRLDINYSLDEFVERIIRLARFNEDFSSAEKDVLYLNYTKSVIEMTTIDHIHKATADNIGKLILLWQRIKDRGLDIDMPTLNMVKVKAAAMIQKALFQIGDDEEERELLKLNNASFFYSIGGVNEERLKSEIERSNELMRKNYNPIIKNKIENKYKKVLIDEFERMPSEESPVDIETYNKWICKGQNNYIEFSGIIEKMHSIQNDSQKKNKGQDMQEVINDIDLFFNQRTCDCFLPHFFFRVLNFIKIGIDNNENRVDDQIQNKARISIALLNLMKKILKSLRDYISCFERRMPAVFRPYFQHSFYEYDKESNELRYCEKINANSYDCKDYENKFFFASYYCDPFSVDRLKEAYEYYTLLYHSYSSNFALEVKITEVQMNANIKKQEEDIKNTQRSSLQTLGLFTGFLAFIVTSIGTFRVANNIEEYIIYSLTYTLAIALFAFLISDSNVILTYKSDNKKGYLSHLWETIISNGKTLLFGIIFVFLLLFAVCYFYFHGFSSTQDTTETNSRVSVTIDNSNTPSTMLNLKDMNQNDTLKATANISDNAEIANGADSVDGNNNTDSVP